MAPGGSTSSAWRGYEAWCRALACEPLDGGPELLAHYATRRVDQGVAVSRLRVNLAAIRTAHLLVGVPLDLRDPQLAMVVEGITRECGVRSVYQAAPAVPDVLRQLLAACGPATAALGARDRAMLERPLFCAVTKVGRPTGAALYDKAVARLVKGTATRAGLDRERYSGHSLRAGLATAAGNAGAACPTWAPNLAREHPGGAGLPPPGLPVAQQRHRMGVRGGKGRGGLSQPSHGESRH